MTQLPENIELLSSSELRNLIKENRDKLQLYVSNFQSFENMKDGLYANKDSMLKLKEQFVKLQKDIDLANEELNSLRVINAQYTKDWQDINQIIQENFSEDTLKKKLQLKIKQFEEESSKIEAEMLSLREPMQLGDLETLIERFTSLRTNYHLNREKLVTWNTQGTLRK